MNRIVMVSIPAGVLNMMGSFFFSIPEMRAMKIGIGTPINV